MKIVYHRAVLKKDLSQLTSSVKLRVKSAIQRKLRTEPELFGNPLRRSLHCCRKLRIGDYRIVYTIHNNKVIVWGIIHRLTVYSAVISRINK